MHEAADEVSATIATHRRSHSTVVIRHWRGFRDFKSLKIIDCKGALVPRGVGLLHVLVDNIRK